MKYERRQQKGKHYSLVFFFLLLIIGGILLYHFFIKKEDEKIINNLCGISQVEYDQKRNEILPEIYPIEEFGYYGKGLHLRKQSFDRNDDLLGKTIVLHSICDNQKYYFPVLRFLNQGIAFEGVKQGEYRILVQDTFDEYSITTTKIIPNFDSITINNHHKHIEFDKGNKNQLLVKVKDQQSDLEKVDILVDPGYNYDDFGGLDLGYFDNGTKAYQETFLFSKELVKALNEKGYRAKLTRDNVDQKQNIFGENSRMQLAYNQKAHYYINIQMQSVLQKEVGGLWLEKPFNVSYGLADNVMSSIKQLNPKIIGVLAVNSKGVLSQTPVERNGKSYESNFYIRELGGKILKAGEFSEFSELNKNFAYQNNYGIETYLFNIGYITNKADVDFIRQNRENLAKAFAKGFNIE